MRTRVGHSFIKPTMAETGAVFGGEHSAHYYFRDFWRADSGMLAALHVLAALGEQDAPAVGAAWPTTTATPPPARSTRRSPTRPRPRPQVRAAFADRGATFDELDGLTVDLRDGSWFNLRASNTEPLLRLNVEAADEAAMAALRDEVLAIVRA